MALLLVQYASGKNHEIAVFFFIVATIGVIGAFSSAVVVLTEFPLRAVFMNRVTNVQPVQPETVRSNPSSTYHRSFST